MHKNVAVNREEYVAELTANYHSISELYFFHLKKMAKYVSDEDKKAMKDNITNNINRIL